ncbi:MULTISPECIES: Cof-type HAD-IIB family hydrolase [Vagococcus]|uniref:HMP-PP hydrolase (Pyridoxal phosphatase) Cof, detected in genetic screen for thiamin metabolic genes (PMID:15292217) n=1 Tax=Vagococcus fluvialis bH819 TaxID=1255619 RepID=A0A1X6WSC8_9ENTE|nr:MULTISPECIES: Cof-type HAD-IIB family hydrolase [Vagococcus]SLM87261.1 HMP-PP hydrolase (pyridoxal phosphatase) Cof, detected in genetic screen for thiamin metabolic genes (PMID:15292217) [Vagococcus fluvialis bH819]HCM89073.1 HAD family hydrolase [Vagococcus sp.]
MIKLVAVDMDGTFLSSNKEYNRERFMKIYEEMKRKSIKFVVASGNQYYQLKSFFPEIAEEISFVAENGALVISEGEELFCGKMSDDLVQEVLDFIKEQPEVFMIVCGRKSAYTSEKEPQELINLGKTYYHRLQVLPEITQEIDDIFFKVATNVPVDETERFLAFFNEKFSGRLEAVSSGHGDIDLIIPGLHKANGLQILQEKWGIDASEIVAFGDGGNDLEMLRHVKYSYAMENSSRKVKKTATYLAPDNDNEGVLAVLEKILTLSQKDRNS